MITSGGKRNPAKLDLGAGTRTRQRRINTALESVVVITLRGVVLNQVAGLMVKAEQEHRQYLKVRAAWQVEILDPYPVRTPRRRLRAVLTLAGMSSSRWAWRHSGD